VAVLHRVGGSIRGVIGTTATPGLGAAADDDTPKVTAWREFRAQRTSEITAWLDEHDVAAVVVVIPSASVVCRTCTLPDADAEHLAEALALQAEAHQLAAVPAYRRATAVLPGAPGETSRNGIIVDWPNGAADPALDTADAPWGDRPVTYAPDVAAVAALLNGQRPDEPLVWFDRTDGSLALAISHANGAILRAARVSPGDVHAWAQSVGRVVAETALSVGHTPAFTERLVGAVSERVRTIDHDAALIAPPAILEVLRRRVGSAPGDDRFWRDYGVAVGAFAAASGALAALTRLQLAPPIENPPAFRRILNVLSDRKWAARIAVLAVLAILFTPLLAAGLRLAVLKLKLPDLDEYRAAVREAEVQLAVYRELKTHARPMTKLLGDIANCTPEGIDLDQVRIDEGRVRLSGRAKPDTTAKLTAPEVVAQMHRNLRRTDIFDEIYVGWGEPNTFGAYEFTLSASIVNPYRRFEYPRELDYGEWSMAERMYPGTGGSSPAPPATTPAVTPPAIIPAEFDEPVDEPADSDEPPRPRNGGSLVALPGDRPQGDNNLPGRSEGVRGGALPASQDIPEPLTQEQVDAMDLADAQEMYAKLSQAIQRARTDEETKERLWRDWRMVKARVRDLKRAQQ
jgi:hypothetical protein